jgi:hypothetical protein
LGFENCESRQLLAGASIFGTVVQTPTSSGFSPTDVAMPGVPIELYKDNGDNNFDPGTDMLAKPTQNSAPVTGAFSFTDIADGHYYLRELVPAGFIQSAGEPVYTFDVIGGVVRSASELAIDTFQTSGTADTFQEFEVTGANNPLSFMRSGTGILGTNTVTVNVLGPVDINSAAGYVGILPATTDSVFNLATADNVAGTALTLKYDNANTDLTAGGNNGIRFDIDFLQLLSATSIDLDITVTGPGGTATYTGTLAEGTTTAFVPFSSFMKTGTFSFSDVSSIQFLFNKDGETNLDFQLDNIVADINDFRFGNFKVPVDQNTSCLSGYVYVDCNSNGIKDNGERGIACVTIKLTGTNDLGQAVSLTTKTDASGKYVFANLRPGTYTLTEVQPKGFADGKDTIGTPGGTTGNDVFSNINLLAGVKGVNNNFGEQPQKCSCPSKPTTPCPPKPPVCPPKHDFPRPGDCDPRDHKPSGPCNSGPVRSNPCNAPEKPKSSPSCDRDDRSVASSSCGPKGLSSAGGRPKC